MQFGLFYEMQLPRPWESGDEHRLYKECLEQVVLADRLGFDYVWEVEHHFLEEYSHSSAPEVFLGAVAAVTQRIRLGHGIVQLPLEFNHTARVAERVATLDLLSDGRVDLGTGEASSKAELGGFGVDWDTKRDQWTDHIEAVSRMMVETPFAGWDGKWLQMPPRNVVPKPLQKPHPPLWVACSRRETILLAAQCGIGALSFQFIEPERAADWVAEYEAILASEDCVPAGFAVNPRIAIVLPLMCHPDEQTAVDRGLDSAHFFGYALLHYYAFGDHRPGRTNVWQEFEANREKAGFRREDAGQTGGPLGASYGDLGVLGLRGAIGTPDQVRSLLRRYEEAGVDQVIFMAQMGRVPHEQICESLELMGAEVIGEFAERHREQWERKCERLAPAIEAALARKAPPRTTDKSYSFEAAAKA